MNKVITFDYVKITSTNKRQRCDIIIICEDEIMGFTRFPGIHLPFSMPIIDNTTRFMVIGLSKKHLTIAEYCKVGKKSVSYSNKDGFKSGDFDTMIEFTV